MIRRTTILFCALALTAASVTAHGPRVVTATVETAPLYNYDDAPATPDADDPLDDQNTVYGLTVAAGTPMVFVTERERGVVRQLRIAAQPDGTLGYDIERTFVFDTTFDLVDSAGVGYAWTPCREAAEEAPQSEGLVVDTVNGALYVAFETIGLYRIPLPAALPKMVCVGVDRLVEPITAFGRAYRAIPDDDEFECEYEPQGSPGIGEVDAAGSAANAGWFLSADLEGLSIIAGLPGQTILLASSQGDSSFHYYRVRGDTPRHLGSFLIDGVAETDGVHFVPGPITRRFPLGLLVVQNGEAPEPPDTSDVNGYEFDGSTQFRYVNVVETLKALRD
jgi:3-phytase